MSDILNKVQEDELNKSNEETIETYNREDVKEELKKVCERVKKNKPTMTDEEKERDFNAIRDLEDKLE